MEVETIVAVSLMMAVFSAVAAIGSSIVLGAGFERLRTGFEVIRKQTGFFSDAIHRLEEKVEKVDEQTSHFSQSIEKLDAKVTNVGEQANVFSDTLSSFGEKVGIVEKQTGFFSEAIYKLEQQVELVARHEEVVAEKLEKQAGTELLSTNKAEALVCQAEDLLSQVSVLADRLSSQAESQVRAEEMQQSRIPIPQNLNQFSLTAYKPEEEDARFH